MDFLITNLNLGAFFGKNLILEISVGFFFFLAFANSTTVPSRGLE